MIQLGKFLIKSAFLLYIIENFYFGWNATAQSVLEANTDRMVSVLLGIGIMIYIMPLFELYEKTVKTRTTFLDDIRWKMFKLKTENPQKHNFKIGDIVVERWWSPLRKKGYSVVININERFIFLSKTGGTKHVPITYRKINFIESAIYKFDIKKVLYYSPYIPFLGFIMVVVMGIISYDNCITSGYINKHWFLSLLIQVGSATTLFTLI